MHGDYSMLASILCRRRLWVCQVHFDGYGNIEVGFDPYYEYLAITLLLSDLVISTTTVGLEVPVGLFFGPTPCLAVVISMQGEGHGGWAQPQVDIDFVVGNNRSSPMGLIPLPIGVPKPLTLADMYG